MSSAPTDQASRGVHAAEISDGVVHLMSTYTGRGPTKARTYISPHLVTVVLEDLLTKGERSLVRDGHTDLVLRSREAYQQTMRQELTELVEHILGGRVTAFMSANHLDPDVAVEIFLLEGRDAPQA